MAGRMIFGPHDMDDMPEEVKEALAGAFGELMGGKKNRDGWREKEKVLPEARIERIKEAANFYAASMTGCPYGPGDWVTPRRGYNIKGAGHPYIVVEVDQHPQHRWSDDDGRANNGRRLDMRVMTLIDGDISCFWAESYSYEQIDLGKYIEG